MTGCTKTGVKNAIEAIGQYLIDNSEKIAGDFDGMIDFSLEVNFKTNCDEANWPEIKFANHHYLPFSEELSEKIFNAKEKENESDFHCGVEESGGHAYNCNDCPNKCEEYYQWDKEMKKETEPHRAFYPGYDLGFNVGNDEKEERDDKDN